MTLFDCIAFWFMFAVAEIVSLVLVVAVVNVIMTRLRMWP